VKDWPWEYFFTMATCFMGWSEDHFWKSTPRLFMACIKQYTKISRDDIIFSAIASRHENPYSLREDEPQEKVKPVSSDHAWDAFISRL
jgi:hypothetical protein